MEGLPSLAFGPTGSTYEGEDKLQHFFFSALMSLSWGPKRTKSIGRLYEHFDAFKKAHFNYGTGYSDGDVHADDLGADFGFNLLHSPTTSIRFFVRYPNETLGGAIGRLAGSGTAVAAPNVRHDAQAAPKSTGAPLPSGWLDSAKGGYGPKVGGDEGASGRGIGDDSRASDTPSEDSHLIPPSRWRMGRGKGRPHRRQRLGRPPP